MSPLSSRSSLALRSLALAAAVTVVAGSPRTADACGGFFCAQTPVIQTGEVITFAVDHERNEVTAIINIRYQGAATDFAWVLPTTTPPQNLRVGSTWSFQVAQQLTAPTFRFSSIEEDGVCGSGGRANRNGGPVPASAPAEGDASQAPPGGVQVLQRKVVGPYDSVVLQGTSIEAVKQWLVDNQYNVTDEMMEAVAPYLAQNFTLTALKLQKDNDVGDIQPIAITLKDTKTPCIPIVLTAIAAQADMDITAIVLSDEGRAIPENYFHVTLNEARIDWLNGGQNYRQIVSEAADEANGNAFTTEYAGPSNIFKDRIFVPGQYDLPRLEGTMYLDEFLTELGNQGLYARSETAGILVRHIPDSAFQQAGVDARTFQNCPQCFIGSFANVPFTPGPAVKEIDERIVKPEQEAQKLFDDYSYLTRLYTLISPEEMTKDPEFVFKKELPEISNNHTAKMILHCGLGGAPGSAGVSIILEDGRTITFESSNQVDRTVIDAMPAAQRIEDLNQGLLVQDNTPAIAEALDGHNNRSGCGGCTTTSDHSTGSAFAFLALFGLAALRRSRSR